MKTLLRNVFSVLPLALILILPASGVRAENPEPPAGIPPRAAADYIHAVIEAGRTIYSEVIVERLGFTISLNATENWKAEDKLPLPAQFLLLSSQAANAKGVGMTYRLMSLWPINKKNGPRTEFEKIGLQETLKNPDQPRTRIVSSNGKSYYEAIYPDKAVTKSCVSCHNGHPKSPKRDFKPGDVMGGISVRFPIEKNYRVKGTDDYLIPAEIVADYIHSVLESDRQVYSNYVVNRLQERNIVYASEHWWEDNALLLPAQFLLNTSELISFKKLDLDFKLISTWPINIHNGAANEFERVGLEYVVRHPLIPYIGKTQVGGKQYFQAVYPDFAVTPACVSCHNSHPNSPKRDFKLNDVMGGIVMSFPLD